MFNVFEEIKSKVTITQEAEERGIRFVSGGTGGVLKCSCPIHNENDASFFLYPGIEFENFWCYGCRVGGDVTEFVRRIEKWTKRKTINYFREKYNIQIAPIVDIDSIFEKKTKIGSERNFNRKESSIYAMRTSKMFNKFLIKSKDRKNDLASIKSIVRNIDEAEHSEDLDSSKFYMEIMKDALERK